MGKRAVCQFKTTAPVFKGQQYVGNKEVTITKIFTSDATLEEVCRALAMKDSDSCLMIFETNAEED